MGIVEFVYVLPETTYLSRFEAWICASYCANEPSNNTKIRSGEFSILVLRLLILVYTGKSHCSSRVPGHCLLILIYL